jgi:hypothetical protein
MTQRQFNNLDELEQTQALNAHGVFIAQIQDEKYYYKLYQLHNFYVEKRYSIEHQIINGQYAYEYDEEMLKPYLDSINPNIK